jgi:type II secretory pathway pseudopilin PulG
MSPRFRQARPAERGYNMVMLIVVLTVLNIALAATLPLMSTMIQREKEEELVFRGFQYAEAIRIFKIRFQRYPNKLEELLEVKPRCIRQLWKDPMTKDGKWGLIFDNNGVPLIPQVPTGGVQTPPRGEPPQEGDGGGQGASGTPKNGETVTIGPIVGVRSKSHKAAHLVFYGHERYDEWQFTANLLVTAAQRGSVPGCPGCGNPGQVLLPNFSTRWLGRPMQFADQAQPQNGTLPGQQKPQPPDGKGGTNRKPSRQP